MTEKSTKRGGLTAGSRWQRSITKALSNPLCLLFAVCTVACEVSGQTPDQVLAYKQTVDSGGTNVTLYLDVFTPPDYSTTNQYPAIVFFFGGAWKRGSTDQFYPHCEYLASRGMVAISAQYRTENDHGTTPQECVKDGKSAIRWVRENAATLGIDPDRIAAGGGSAGGQVAAAAATLTAFDEPSENLAISSKPNALVCYNAVFDNGPGGYGYSRVKDYWEDFSPLHNIDSTAPPTAVFLGTADTLVPVSAAENYQSNMVAAGVRCDIHLYEGQTHGFFNYPNAAYNDTVFKTDEFLVSLGYLSNPHVPPVSVTHWETIYGDAGFSGGSDATDSPVTTDADQDSIAANFSPVDLLSEEFVRLTGTVTFDAPVSGADFRIGLFNGDDPVTPGDGTGYVGIWAEAPATADTKLAAGDGTGSNHPFESVSAIDLGPVPAADSTVPAGTPIDFSLMIARNVNDLDISVRFTDGGSYDQEQNLVNMAVSDYHFDSVAFLMSGALNASQGQYSNIKVGVGDVFPMEEPVVVPEDPGGDINIAGNATGSEGGEFADYSALSTGNSWGDSSVSESGVTLTVSRTGNNEDVSSTVWTTGSSGPDYVVGAEMNLRKGSNPATAAAAFESDLFIAFRLDAETALTMDSISVDLWRNGSGSATDYQFAYDAAGDGYTTNDLIGDVFSTTGTGPDSTFSVSNAVASSASTNQEVRLYMWGGSSLNGNSHLYNVAVDYTRNGGGGTEVADVSMGIINGGAQVVVEWQGTNAMSYALQFRNSLTSGSWSNVVENIVGSDAILSITNAVDEAEGFYRTIALP